MAKRHLTRRQQWRIDKIQSERAERATRRGSKVEDDLTTNDFGVEQLGLVIAHYGVQADVESEQGEVYRCHLRANLPSLVTGDKVIWRAGKQLQGIVVAVESRQSVLCRPDAVGRLKAVAANVDLLVIVFAPLPTPYHNLIDRYLVAAEAANIEPLLVLNKVDLINQENKMLLDELVTDYKQLGYSVLSVSTYLPDTMQVLQSKLESHTSVFVGQSGVGKSSLVNKLLPNVTLKVGDLSILTNKGTHTTTTAKLFHMPTGGDLIDSPGIREFGLTHISRSDVELGFIEFRPYWGRCKFRNCQHDKEPGCALLKAVEEGKITQKRLDSYKHILSTTLVDNK